MTDAPSDGRRVDRPDDWIVPRWTVAANVHALMTTRSGGISEGPFAAPSGGGMNLGLGSGDDLDAVHANRSRFARSLPSAPRWLRQVHGVRVVDAASVDPDVPVDADASYTDRPNVVCAILVADCMPVLLSARDGTRVAAAHAGWRGLAAGVLEATISAGGFDPGATSAWIGPSIGPTRFEVGDDVRRAFVEAAGASASAVHEAFVRRPDGKWLADLAALAVARLAACGVRDVVSSGLCTASDAVRFYSYRRDGVTGRMAATIWLDG